MTDDDIDSKIDAVLARRNAPKDNHNVVSLKDKRKIRADGKAKEGSEKEKRTPQADRLIALSLEAKLFHDAGGNCYADLDINGH